MRLARRLGEETDVREAGRECRGAWMKGDKDRDVKAGEREEGRLRKGKVYWGYHRQTHSQTDKIRAEKREQVARERPRNPRGEKEGKLP